MEGPKYDGWTFITWMIWYYPGLIALACVLCHVSAKPSHSIAPGKSANAADNSAIDALCDADTETSQSQGDAAANFYVTKPYRTDLESFPEASDDIDTDRRGVPRNKSSESFPKMAIFFQVVQLAMLERMGHLAAENRIETGYPIFGSVYLLAICTIIVLLSAAALQRTLLEEKGDGTAHTDPKVAELPVWGSSRILVVALVAALVPWYELLSIA